MPKVTVAITTFNRVGLLPRAICSVMEQNYRDFELLVLDNSSTDGTEGLMGWYSDQRIRYLRHPRMTIGKARNLALAEAKGKYLAFLDDDDEWIGWKLRQQVELLDLMSESVGLVYSGFVRVSTQGKRWGMHFPQLTGKVLHGLLWQKDPFTGSASNPMLRVSVLKALGGYDETLKSSEDWELYLRLAEHYSVAVSRNVHVRIHDHSGARLGDKVMDAAWVERLVYDRYKSVMSPKLRSYYLQKIGGKMCRDGAFDDGRTSLRLAIRENPMNLMAYGQYGLSYCGQRFYHRAHRFYLLLRDDTYFRWPGR